MASIFETLVGKEEKLGNQDYYYLATKGKDPAPKTFSKSSNSSDERISGLELERAYRLDSFVYNAVNVAVQMIMSAGWKITSPKAASRKYLQNFLDNISKVGADTTWTEILTRIYRDAYIHGGAWDELVWNKADTRTVDIKVLDPIEMDFARDEVGNVVLDKNERPIGYTQAVAYGTNTEGKGDPVPDSVTLKGKQIFLSAKRISYIPLYTFGSGFIGFGRVEPAYKATIWKLNLLKAGTESANRRGFSPIIAKVGNENVHPTPQMIQNVLENLKKLDSSKYMALPWYVDLTSLDVQAIETYDGLLKYLTAMQSAALGVPIPFVTGLGEDTNRATLGTQLEVFQVQLNSMAQTISRNIEKHIFKPIMESAGYSEIPKLEWNVVTTFVEEAKQAEKDSVNKTKE